MRKVVGTSDISSAAALLGRKGGSSKSESKRAAVRENGRKGGRPRRYYGFREANKGQEPAWFCSEAAARRFGIACGWEDLEVVTTYDPEPDDVMDTPSKPWRED